MGYFANAQYDVFFAALPGVCFAMLAKTKNKPRFPRRRKQEAIKGERAARHFGVLWHIDNFYTAKQIKISNLVI